MKITNLMIILVLIGTFVTVMGMFIGDLNSNYGSNIDQGNIEVYNKINNLTQQTEEMQNKIEDLKEKSGIFDILGGILSDAYNALKIGAKSFDILDFLINLSIKDAKLPYIFKVAFSTIILIVIFIGIILTAIIKWPL